MSEITLKRFAATPMGTFGRMRLGDWEWFTVERPWAGNAPGVSCIPVGSYGLTLGTFYGGDGVGGRPDYPAYELHDVPARALIKIHRANTAAELNGCIAPGKALGWVKEAWAVTRSGEAYEEFMRIAAEHQPWKIVITWDLPT